MTSSKSRRRRRRPRQRTKKKAAARIKQRLKHDVLPDVEWIVEPSGEVKMSEVLRDFVEPYAEIAETKEAYGKLLTIAVVAWNTALLPESERQEAIDQILGEVLEKVGKQAMEDAEEILRSLMARKEKHFSEYKRTILDFELTDVGEGYQLLVASTPPSVEATDGE